MPEAGIFRAEGHRVKRFLHILVWTVLAVVAAIALATIALHRGEQISASWFVLAAGCSYLVAYRLYSAFIAAKLLALDNTRATPPSGTTTDATLCPRTNGSCSAIILLRLRGQVR